MVIFGVDDERVWILRAHDRPSRPHGAVAALPASSEQAAQHHPHQGISFRVRIEEHDFVVRDALEHPARLGVDAERLRPGVLVLRECEAARVDRGLVLGLDRVHDDDILSRQEGRTPSLMLGPVAPLALARAVPGLLALLA